MVTTASTYTFGIDDVYDDVKLKVTEVNGESTVFRTSVCTVWVKMS